MRGRKSGDCSDSLAKLRQLRRLCEGEESELRGRVRFSPLELKTEQRSLLSLSVLSLCECGMWWNRVGGPCDWCHRELKATSVWPCLFLSAPIHAPKGGSSKVFDLQLRLLPLLSFYTSDWDQEPDLPWCPQQQPLDWTKWRRGSLKFSSVLGPLTKEYKTSEQHIVR